MNELENILNKIYLDFKNLNYNINTDNITIDTLETAFIEIEKYDIKIQHIENTLNIIKSIKNNIQLIYNNKISNIKKKILPNSDNLYENNILHKYNIELKNVTNNELFKNNIYTKCPVINISKKYLDHIINSPIYYIEETKEYCIKINNKLIKGNIGNIFMDNDKNKNKIKKCNKLYCNNSFYNKKECKFYHDEEDIRNFPNYSWKSIQKNKLGKVKNKNKILNYEQYDLENTRFLGSLDTLHEDLSFTNVYEKKLRNKQLMHDILLYQILDQYLNNY